MRVAWVTRILLFAGLAFSLLLGDAGPVGAHPLGNFTTNRYARVEVGASVVRVHYVLDEAELVAFRQRDAIGREGTDTYLTRRLAEVGDGLRLLLDGRRVHLRPVASELAQPAGQGGLTTLRIDAVFEATLPAGDDPVTVAFEDLNGADLIGWREIVVATSAGARLVDGPRGASTDRSNGLRDYPTHPGAAPLDERSVRFDVARGSDADGPAGLDRSSQTKGTSGSDRFVGLLASTTSSPIAVVGALLAAFAFGVVHALGPGHGKTVMAAYLVSTQGRRRDALALGAVVSLMHTASVLALAGLLATVGRNVDTARVYPVLTLVAGVLVVGVGARLVARRWRARPGGNASAPHQPQHLHEHEPHHDHQSHHGHVHGPGGHTHDLAPDVRPLSRAGLLALGTSGGLFPSPSAVVVLVGAFAVGRTLLGFALIAAFSIGLAAMLVTVGMLLIAGRGLLTRSRFDMQLRRLPVAGAAAIVVLGAVLVVQGVTQLR